MSPRNWKLKVYCNESDEKEKLDSNSLLVSICIYLILNMLNLVNIGTFQHARRDL